jgi:hypothetical protein
MLEQKFWISPYRILESFTAYTGRLGGVYPPLTCLFRNFWDIIQARKLYHGCSPCLSVHALKLLTKLFKMELENVCFQQMQFLHKTHTIPNKCFQYYKL